MPVPFSTLLPVSSEQRSPLVLSIRFVGSIKRSLTVPRLYSTSFAGAPALIYHDEKDDSDDEHDETREYNEPTTLGVIFTAPTPDEAVLGMLAVCANGVLGIHALGSSDHDCL